jgi:hypothetical protein
MFALKMKKNLKNYSLTFYCKQLEKEQTKPKGKPGAGGSCL